MAKNRFSRARSRVRSAYSGGVRRLRSGYGRARSIGTKKVKILGFRVSPLTLAAAGVASYLFVKPVKAFVDKLIHKK